jgi:hypothetical protein
MSQTIVVSDKIFQKLQSSVEKRGLTHVEQLFEEWLDREEELNYRRTIVQEITELRERLFVKYGEMANSVELIREDRSR